MLVTALEDRPEVPLMEVVTERLVHEERKMLSGRSDGNAKAMTNKTKWSNKPKGRCHYCHQIGHYRCGSLYFLNCRSLERSNVAKDVWHKRFGHLGIGNLRRLAADGLVDGFNFEKSK